MHKILQIAALIFFIVSVLPNPLYATNHGPVGYWSFNDGTANDSSLNGSTGTPQNGVAPKTKTDCAIGACFEFDVTNDYIDMGNKSILEVSGGNFTLSAWVKKDNPNMNSIIHKGEGGNTPGNTEYTLDLVGVSGNSMRLFYNQVWRDATVSTFTDLTNWHHVAAVVQNQIITFYLDAIPFGLPVGATGTDATNKTFPFMIGRNGNGTSYADGRIDEVKVFNYALTPTQIIDDMLAHSGGVSCVPSENNCYQGLNCESTGAFNTCIPLLQNRQIGTWCDDVSDCDTGSGTLSLSCDIDANHCVGATSGISCSNQTINQNPQFGDTFATLDSTERCDEGLFCDPDDTTCQNDFGSAAIPADKLGDSADDIRDQIRNVINIVLGFLGVAGVIVTIYGGAVWMTAFGEDEKVEKGRKTIIAGAIGLVIIGVAWTIVSYILNVTQDIS